MSLPSAYSGARFQRGRNIVIGLSRIVTALP
jgi:hypothetical protein